MHSIVKALLVRVEMQCISACLVKSWLFEWNPLLDGARSCSPSKQFGKSFPGRIGLCHSKGHVALFWTNPCSIYPLLFQWSCQIGLPVQDWTCNIPSPVLHRELSDMNFESTEWKWLRCRHRANFWRSHGWKKGDVLLKFVLVFTRRVKWLDCNLENNISILLLLKSQGCNFLVLLVCLCVQGAELLNWNPKCAGVPCTPMTGKCFVGDSCYWWLS